MAKASILQWKEEENIDASSIRQGHLEWPELVQWRGNSKYTWPELYRDRAA